MKRFLLFSFPEYYPCGGMGDVKHQFDTIEEARAWLGKEENLYDLSEYAYLFDCEKREVVWDKEEFFNKIP